MAHQSVRTALLVVALVLIWSLPVLADDGVASALSGALPWSASLAWLVPIGLGLLACGAVPAGRVASVIRVGWLAMCIAALGYWLCGFAFQFGGLGFVADHPDLAGLVREWTWAPLDELWGTEWGVLGLEGYLMQGSASTPTALALFFAQLPWITTAVAIPLWSLQGRAKPVVLFLSGVLIASVYTVLGNWTWGGGWLANLGLNLGLGHGFVDLGGASAVHLAGAASAFAGMLAFGTRSAAREATAQLALPTMDAIALEFKIARDGETYVPMPPLHLPILATLGTWLALIGSIGWLWSTPPHVTNVLQGAWMEVGIGLVLAAAGGAATALAFSWMTTGEGNALMTARGVLGALVAAGAGLAFVPLWASVAIGAGAGLLIPLVQYLVEHVLRLDDPTSAIATHGISALWGLFAVAIFADGHAGQGWNRVSGPGIAGYLSAPGYAVDWVGQFRAQATGSVATFLTAFVMSWFLFATVQGLTRAWQGEYTIRLPRRPQIRRRRLHQGSRRRPQFRFVKTTPAPDAEPPAPPETRPHPGWLWVRARFRSIRERLVALRARQRAPDTAENSQASAGVETDQ